MDCKIAEKRVALITGYGWAGITVSVAMCVEFLTSKGYFVDIYLDSDLMCDSLGLNKPLFNYQNSNVKFFNEKEHETSNQMEYNHIMISKKNMTFVHFLNGQNYRYDWIIGFDPDGLIRSGVYGLRKDIPFFYFSLEFYEKNDETHKAEVFFAQKSLAVLTQDKYRGKILSKLLSVNEKKVFPVYNSTIGNIIETKSSYLRDLFHIKENKKIILAVGTLLEITGIDKILDSVESWSNEYVLVVHGWTTDASIKERITVLTKKFEEKVFYSDTPLTHDEKFKVFSSADIGLIYYKPINLNLKYAAWSSGKFFDFARCGVPVIANNIPNMDTLVEDNQCGIILNSFNNLDKAFKKIFHKYEIYQKGCFESYKKYSFNESFRKALKEVLN